MSFEIQLNLAHLHFVICTIPFMITTNFSLDIAIENLKQNYVIFSCSVYSHKKEVLLFMSLI